ncbi:hypothetical protein IIZ72_01650, partial [Candidatus Saccharibacteria bacterium]|nr:hypothetical protein [Candidatus Saccharibacteria bacterium]
KETGLSTGSALMRAHPWGTLFCFNPLFVFNVSLHTPLIIQWNPCEAYQLIFIIKHKFDIVNTFTVVIFML